ncbi:MAG TPA: molybdopterin cofactor-binding domain-containing protein, partial [Longimicrobium sp.]|nr:molybdopterin cofactor-binding domain-containing protein [Longimicrobium sp.]
MTPAVGRSVFRKDGMPKTTGEARYVDDLHFDGMLYGRTIRAEIPRGRVRSITLEFDPAGFTVVDWRDIPGPLCNFVALIVDDQPFLVKDEVNHVAEPILLLAHEDREALLAARVHVEYDVEEPVLDPETSPTVFKEIHIHKGDVDAAMATADRIVEGTYRTGHQEHVYIEPNGVIAVPQPNGGMTVYGSMQCPYYVHKALRHLLQV